MHNTLTVDDYSQNDLNENELWSIKRDAVPSELQWKSNEKYDIFEGSHTGYERLQKPVKHIRKFELNKENNILKIKDIVVGEGKYLIKCHFHFDENVEVEIIDKDVYCNKKSENLIINFDINLDFSLELKQEFISKSYNSKMLAPYLIVSFKINKAIELTTIIKNSKK